MIKPKIAILGPGSIGKFHAREFKDAGCEVTAILCSSQESAERKAKFLKEEFNIEARPYHILAQLLEEEQLDAVSICTPADLHTIHVKQCLESNLHVLCEKPFTIENYQEAKTLLELAQSKGKNLTINTQLVYLLEKISKHFKPESIETFSMYMEAQLKGTRNLITEAIPHMNSFLIRLLGDRKITNLSFPKKDDENVIIQFNYGDCKAEYLFKLKPERPRTFHFEINGTRFEKAGTYQQQQIAYNGKAFNIEDPLKVSIRRFISALSNKAQPLVSKAEILKNIELQDKFLKELSL